MKFATLKFTSLVFGLTAAIAQSTTAYALSGCNAIFRLGLYNVSAQTSNTDARSLALSEFCSYDYNYANSAQQGNIKAGLSFLGFSLGGGGGTGSASIATTQKNLCTKGFNSNAYISNTSSYSKQLYQGSLDAWTRCNELSSRGLIVNIDTSPDFTTTNVSLSWPGTAGPVFKGFYVPTNTDDLKGNAACTISVNAGVPVTASKATNFQLNGSVATFNCSRVFYPDGKGNRFSNPTRLSFNTSEGNINVDLPPIGFLPLQTVSQVVAQATAQTLSHVQNQRKTEPVFAVSQDWVRGTSYPDNDGIIVYSNPPSINIGNGFNQATGTFTAPISGYYSFAYSFGTTINKYNDFGKVGFKINGNFVKTNAVSAASSFFDTDIALWINSANNGVFYLKAGDRVSLSPQDNNNSKPYYWNCNFTGQYLHS